MVIGPRTSCQRPSVTASPSPGGRPPVGAPLVGALGMRGSTGMWLPRPSPGGRPREPPLQGVDGDVVAAAPAPAGGHESRPYRVSWGGVAITGMWLPRPSPGGRPREPPLQGVDGDVVAAAPPRRAATRAAPTGCRGDAWFNGDVVAAAPAPAGGHESRPYGGLGIVGVWRGVVSTAIQQDMSSAVTAAQPRRAATRAAPTGDWGEMKPGAWLGPRSGWCVWVPGGRLREPPLRGIGPRLVVAGPSCAGGRIRLRRLLPRSL